jgi:hypothetical protein
METMTTSLETRSANPGATPCVEFLDSARPEDRKKWLDLYAGWKGRDIMAHPGYVRLFARPCDRVLAATLRTERSGILYPFILRPLSEEPWAAPGTDHCDLTTPYGYGGPFAWGATPAEVHLFWSRFDEWAAGQKVATSFARLSLFQDQRLPFHGENVECGPNIVRRLDVTPEQLWEDYRPEARKYILRAREGGVRVEFDPQGQRLDDFLKIYTSTMDRRQASVGYYFPRTFFEALIQSLAGYFTFVHAMVGSKVVSSEILLLSSTHAYSYLGGTLAEAFAMGPNYLIKHESFIHCRERSVRSVVLGGGYQPNDGILRYKRHFGRNGEVPYLLGRKVYDPAGARLLVERRGQWEREQGRDWSPAPEFFPEYRSR